MNPQFLSQVQAVAVYNSLQTAGFFVGSLPKQIVSDQEAQAEGISPNLYYIQDLGNFNPTPNPGDTVQPNDGPGRYMYEVLFANGQVQNLGLINLIMTAPATKATWFTHLYDLVYR